MSGKVLEYKYKKLLKNTKKIYYGVSETTGGDYGRGG